MSIPLELRRLGTPPLRPNITFVGDPQSADVRGRFTVQAEPVPQPLHKPSQDAAERAGVGVGVCAHSHEVRNAE